MYNPSPWELDWTGLSLLTLLEAENKGVHCCIYKRLNGRVDLFSPFDI